MASLTGNLVAETYKALLKTIDNDILTASEKQITDGLGGGSNVFIDSNGFLRANKYKVTNGLATQFLKADGSLDANTYLTSITGAQVITALGYTPVTDQRTLTINGVTYNLTANRSWTVAGTAAVWGNITGTLSNQTDLQAALNAKFNVPAGTISQYIRGDGTLATFPTLPGGLPIGGTAGQILSKIDATDYNTHWIDNFATQTKNEVKLGQTLAKGAAVYVSSANGTNMIVSAASNASESLSSKTFGLLETGGVTNDLVKCVTFGLLAGLDTSTAQAGDPVWLGVNGALLFGVANKPVAPANMVYIGVVTRVQQNNGEIFVNVQNGFEIEELHDVLIQSKANNQGLFYESSTGLWKNKSIATVLGYTPQAQLDGTGFVKASGTTISYDNSTYLTTADAASTYQLLTNLSTDLTASATKYPSVNAVIAGLATKQPLDADLTAIAELAGTSGFLIKTAANTWSLDTNTYLTTATAASTYQRLDKMVSNLLASDTEYPNSNAVIAALALKANSANPVFTGNMTISGAEPKLFFTDTDNNPDYTIFIDSGIFYIYDQTAGATRFSIGSTGNINAGVGKSITAGSFVKESGTAAQFLKADGSIDSSTYVTSASLANYLLITTAASTYQRLDKMVSNLLASDTEYPNSNAVLAKLALKADAANPVFTGDLSISGATPRLYFVDTDQNPDYTVFIDSGFFYIYDQTAGATRFSINSSGNISTGVGKSITAGSFVRDGGTASQFLMADGSVTTFAGVIGSGTTNYIPKWTSASGLGNSIVFDNGTNVGINTALPATILHVNGGTAMTGGWNKTATLQAQYPTLIFNSNASKWGAIGYDHSAAMTFWVNGTSDNVNGTGTVALQILNSGAASFKSWVETNDVLYIGAGGGGGGQWTWGASDAYILSPTSKSLWLTANGTQTNGLKITTTGASIFSNNLTVQGGYIYGQSNSSFIRIDNAVGSQIGYLNFADITFDSDGLRFYTGTGTSGSRTQKFFIAGNGDTSVTGQLSVGRNGLFGGANAFSGIAGGIAVNGSTSSGMIMRLSNTTRGYAYISNNGNLNLETTSGNVILAPNGSPVLTVTPSGPSTFSSTLTTNDVLYVGSGGAGATITWGGTVSYIYSPGAKALSLSIGGTTTTGIYINTNGNIGVGTTTDAGQKFRVQGSLYSTYNIVESSSATGEIGYFRGSNFGLAYGTKSNGAYLLSSYWVSGAASNISLQTTTSAGAQDDRAIIEYSTMTGGWNRVLTLKGTFPVMVFNGNSTKYAGLGYDYSGSGAFILWINASSENVSGTGVQAFNIANNRNAEFYGSITATSFFESSDLRKKKLIESNPIIAGIEKLEAKLYEKNGKIELGYFAQDAELIMPYAVTKNADGFLNLSYREVHTAKIARLEQRVAELEKQLNVA